MKNEIGDGMPFTPARQLPKIKLSEFLTSQIETCGRQQNEIAAELGYERPNIITMFKKGQTKVPIEKIPAFAKVIGVDQAFLMRMAMREYMPETLKAIESVFGTLLTDNEEEIVAQLRELTENRNPKVQTDAHKQKLKEFADSLLERGCSAR